MGAYNGAGERPRGRKRRRALPPTLVLYTAYDICEMLVDIFLGSKDTVETRMAATQLYRFARLGRGNRVSRYAR